MSKVVRHLIVCAVASSAALSPMIAAAQEQSGSQGAPPEAPPSVEPEAPPARSQPPVLLAPMRVPFLWAPGAYARADASLLAPGDRPATARRAGDWYGWQTLAVDGSSTALILAGLTLTLATNSGVAFGASLTIGGLGLLFGGPIVHWVHGYTAKGFVSLFGLRLGLAAGGYIVGGLALLPVLGIWAIAVTGPILAGIGFLTGMIVDAAVFAREEPRPGESEPRPTARWRRPTRPVFAPMVLANGGGGVTFEMPF